MEQRSIWIDNNLPSYCDLAVEEVPFVPEYHKVWPNPMSDELNIGVTMFSAGEGSLRIVDLAGRAVHAESFGALSTGTHAFTLSHPQLESGNYIYQFYVDDQLLYSGKLVRE